jgi:hypothetical protein
MKKYSFRNRVKYPLSGHSVEMEEYGIHRFMNKDF